MTRVENGDNELYSIYRFTDPRNQTIIYIGETNNPDRRYREHISKKGLLYPLVKELEEAGLQIIFDILETTKGITNAYELEKNYIHQYKPLLNRLNNSLAINNRARAEEYAQTIAHYMEHSNFTYEEAVIFAHEFMSSDGDAHVYAIVKKTAILVQQRFQGKSDFTNSEILELALEITGRHTKLALLKNLKGDNQ